MRVGKKTAGVGWVVAMDKQRRETKQMTRLLSGYDPYVYSQWASIPLQGLDRYVLAVKAILDPHCKLEPSIGIISPVVYLCG